MIVCADDNSNEGTLNNYVILQYRIHFFIFAGFSADLLFGSGEIW